MNKLEWIQWQYYSDEGMLCVIVIVDGGWWVREPVIATLIRESYLGKCSHFCVVKMSEEVQVSYRVLRCIIEI